MQCLKLRQHAGLYERRFGAKLGDHQIGLAGDHRFQVDISLVGKLHVEDLFRVWPFTFQDVPGLGILFLWQIVPRHHVGKRIIAGQQGEREDVPSVLQNNALRFVLNGDGTVIQIFNRDRPVSGLGQQGQK